MPAPLNIDKEAVRTLVVAIGVRDAARQLNLPEGTVQAWSARGKWLAHTRPAKPQLPASMQGATIAIQPSEALVSQLNEHGESTKINLAKVAKNASEVLLKKKGNALLKQHQAFKNFVSGSGQLHDWGTGSSGAGFTLNVLSIGGEMTVNGS